MKPSYNRALSLTAPILSPLCAIGDACSFPSLVTPPDADKPITKTSPFEFFYLNNVCTFGRHRMSSRALRVPTNAAPQPGPNPRTNTQAPPSISSPLLGYSGMWWWDWDRWEHELNLMAMNGVNMPLRILGQEYVLNTTHINNHSSLHCPPLLAPTHLSSTYHHHHRRT